MDLRTASQHIQGRSNIPEANTEQHIEREAQTHGDILQHRYGELQNEVDVGWSRSEGKQNGSPVTRRLIRDRGGNQRRGRERKEGTLKESESSAEKHDLVAEESVERSIYFEPAEEHEYYMDDETDTENHHPSDGYHATTEQYHPPTQRYHPSPVEYQRPPDRYHFSSAEYYLRNAERHPPPNEYHPPLPEYLPPDEHHSPPEEYQSLPEEFPHRPAVYSPSPLPYPSDSVPYPGDPSPYPDTPEPLPDTPCRRTSEDPDGDCIRGVADFDYPTFQTIPETGFTCHGRPPGFYADMETGCQVRTWLEGRKLQTERALFAKLNVAAFL